MTCEIETLHRLRDLEETVLSLQRQIDTLHDLVRLSFKVHVHYTPLTTRISYPAENLPDGIK